MKLSSETIKKMMYAIQLTREEELSCGHCYDELDQFIDMKLSGINVEEAMPLVKEHLDRCAACREEYETLLEVLKVMSE
jgi:hypothetical protein